MPDRSLSIEEFLAQTDAEVKKLPPGCNLAAYITARHRQLGEMLAQRLTEQREAAHQEADFSPSGVPPVRPAGDAPGQGPAPADDPPSRG